MAVTYTLVPIPLFYFAQANGLPLGEGSMATFQSTNKVATKPVYTDHAGQFPWPNPVNFKANGEAPGMFFWADDEPYFVQVWDGPNGTGNIVFEVDGYGPGIAGGGGGGPVTSNVSLVNYVVNNVFWRNVGTINSITNGTVICPSNHEGLTYLTTFLSTIPTVGPDIMYVKDIASTSIDNLTFATADFSGGSVPLTGDITPEFYIDLQCIQLPSSNEQLKAVQFPINLHVKNLEQQQMTAIIWAKSFSGTPPLTMNFVQFFGTASSTSPVVTPIPIGASHLSNSWLAYRGTFIVPSVLGKGLGLGDDANYLQVNFPVGLTFHIGITKPKLYLGNIGTVFPEMETYDRVNTIISSPRTGDTRVSLNNFAPFGWVIANDGGIGNASSGGTTRANIDTWPLFNLIWSNVSVDWAPMQDGLPRGVNALADFVGNRAILLTKVVGRVFAGFGSGQQLGQYFGEYTHTLTTNEIPSHQHDPPTGQAYYLFDGQQSSPYQNAFIRTDGNSYSKGNLTGFAGGGSSHNNTQPTTWMNVFFKL